MCQHSQLSQWLCQMSLFFPDILAQNKQNDVRVISPVFLLKDFCKYS